MHSIRTAVLAAFGVISFVFVVQAQVSNRPAASRGTEESYHPPRTSLGDPDLEGTWPGTNMAGVPLQRPESFGTRNVLTDVEFAERRAQGTRRGNQIFQAPGYVTIVNEMIHESRIVPLDGRPHVSRAIGATWATRKGAGKATRWSWRRRTSPTASAWG